MSTPTAVITCAAVAAVAAALLYRAHVKPNPTPIDGVMTLESCVASSRAGVGPAPSRDAPWLVRQLEGAVGDRNDGVAQGRREPIPREVSGGVAGRPGYPRPDVRTAARCWGCVEWRRGTPPARRARYVPLCGKSVDMLYLMRAGYHVVGVDIAETGAPPPTDARRRA